MLADLSTCTRSVASLLIAGCAISGGCARLLHRDTTNYQTVVTAPNRDQAKASQLNRRAEHLMERGKLDEAGQRLHEALIADVSFGPAHNNLGMIYYQQGKFYLAAWEYEYAIRLMPEIPEPHNNLGLVYEAVNKLEAAISFYEAAYSMRNTEPEFIANLARARYRLDADDPAVQPLLQDLIFYDDRPDFVRWARDLLAQEKLPAYRRFDLEHDDAGAEELLPPPMEIMPPSR